MTHITLPRAIVEQALEAICSAKLCEFNSMSSRREMVRLMDEATDILRAALAQQRLTDAQQEMERSIESLKAALAQQAEPTWVCPDSPEHRYAKPGYCKDCGKTLVQQAEPVAHQAEPLTVERLRDALVASRIIQPAAVEDPDGYDDGVTLFRIEALHRRIT